MVSATDIGRFPEKEGLCEEKKKAESNHRLYDSDLCRRKKIKCDGAAPICGNCQAFSLECSYKDTTKKVRLSFGVKKTTN